MALPEPSCEKSRSAALAAEHLLGAAGLRAVRVIDLAMGAVGRDIRSAVRLLLLQRLPELRLHVLGCACVTTHRDLPSSPAGAADAAPDPTIQDPGERRQRLFGERPRQLSRRRRRWMIASRPGPTPIADTRAPTSSSTRRTQARATS